MRLLSVIAVSMLSVLAVFTYAKNTFNTTGKRTKEIISLITAVIIISVFEYVGNEILSFSVFVITAFVIYFLVFLSDFKSGIIHTLATAIVFGCSKIISSALFTFLMSKIKSNDFTGLPISLLENFTGKVIFFIVITWLSYFVFNKVRKNLLLTIVMLIYSAVIAGTGAVYIYFSFVYSPNNKILTFMIILSILMYIMCGVTIFTAVKTIDETEKNSIYKAELLQKENRLIYFENMRVQSDEHSKFIHDIKNHILNIKALAADGKTEDVIKYADSLFYTNAFLNRREYSTNKLINIIVNKYSDECEKEGIKFNAEIRNEDFSFMEDCDIACIIDNLLQNAVEAADNTVDKSIVFTIDSNETDFLRFITVNSCDAPPTEKDGEFVTQKPDKSIHGLGLKILKNTAEKYDGGLVCGYDSKRKTFKAAVICKKIQHDLFQ